MFKSKTKSDFFSYFSSLCMGGAVFGMGLSPLATMDQRVDKMQTRHKEYIENKYLNKDALTIGLFSDNLKKAALQEDATITSALEQTADYFNTTYQKCELKASDISSILAEINPSFKAKIQRDLPKYHEIQRNPEKRRSVSSAYIRSCEQLSKCILDQKEFKNRLSDQECGTLINDMYLKNQTSLKENEAIQMTNFGANKYTNGDTQDSDFDLLYDISQVGTILFKSYKEQPKVIFYNPPNFSTPNNNGNNQSGTRNSSGSGTNQRNQTSSGQTALTPQIQAGMPPTVQENPGTPQSAGGTANGNDTTSPSAAPITEDEELNAFVYKNSPHSTLGNYNKILFQNQCIVIPQETPKTGTPSARGNGSLEEQQSARRDQDLIDQMLDGLRSGNKLQSNTGNTQTGTGSNSTGGENVSGDERQIQEIRENIASCRKKCDDLPFDERHTCVLQCACSEYISPALNKDAQQPVLKEGALIVRFCSVAANMITPDTSAKSVMSIAELFDEISSSVSSLYNGGKLNVKQQKKELLDSSIPKSDISKSVAFTTTIGTKSPIPELSDTEKKAEIQQVKSFLQDSVYGIQRNSFVLLDNYEAEKKSSSITAAEVASTPVSQPANSFRNSASVASLLETQSLLKDNIAASNNLSIFDWVEQNAQLIDTMREVIRDLNTSTQLLNSKKQAN